MSGSDKNGDKRQATGVTQDLTGQQREQQLGTLMVRGNLISTAQLQTARDVQRQKGGTLRAALVASGAIKEEDLVAFLARQYQVPAVNLDEWKEVDPVATSLITRDQAEKYLCCPFNRHTEKGRPTISVAFVDPTNLLAIEDLRFASGHEIEVFVASERAIQSAIERLYGGGGSGELRDILAELGPTAIQVAQDEEDDGNVVDLTKAAEDAPVVRLVNVILTDAIRKGASDIHIEPYEKEMRVRYRIDGMLYEVMKPPLKLKHAIVSRVKIMSSLDIAERRLPQDGRIKLKLGGGREMDYRVSVLPTLFGEKVVMRLLDKSNLELDMTKLGFEAAPLQLFKDSIKRPYGMVLVTGPTGSGKTTTLYSALTEVNRSTVNISTAEDPVEYNLPGINQVMVNDDVGLTFAAALRSFLRQDPNIIMVGEIRDFETAEIAVKAALTGHLVLSTLHTNDAPSTVSRLLNMGIEPFLVTAATNLILAQRLARRVCAECKGPVEVARQALVDLGMSPEDAAQTQCYKGSGCKTCSETGHKGRVALYEVMPITDSVKEFVLNGASTAELKAEAIRQGMVTLRHAALRKLKEGMISVEEVARNTAPDS